MPIGDRIRQIRKEKGMTQTDLAKTLRINPGSVSRLESGENNPADRTVELICREFHVREEWLRQGTGPMMEEKPRDEVLASKLEEILTAGPEDFRRRLISVLVNLPSEKWEVLEEIAGQVQETGTTEADSAEALHTQDDMAEENEVDAVPLSEEEINAKVEEYRALLKRGRAIKLALGYDTTQQKPVSGGFSGNGGIA